jgi:hypothetical protein
MCLILIANKTNKQNYPDPGLEVYPASMGNEYQRKNISGK